MSAPLAFVLGLLVASLWWCGLLVYVLRPPGELR